MNFRKELAPNSGKWAFATATPVSELRACPCKANRLSAYVRAAKDLLPLREGEWGRERGLARPLAVAPGVRSPSARILTAKKTESKLCSTGQRARALAANSTTTRRARL